VRGTRDARVIVANCLFALPGCFLLWPAHKVGCILAQIVFDPFLILRCWRNDLGRQNEPALIESVAMVENSAGCFRDGLAYARPGGYVTNRGGGVYS